MSAGGSAEAEARRQAALAEQYTGAAAEVRSSALGTSRRYLRGVTPQNARRLTIIGPEGITLRMDARGSAGRV